MTFIVVPGTFDYVHEGHRELLDIAEKIADGFERVIVFVNADSMIEERKGLRMTIEDVDRAELIREYYPEYSVQIAPSLDMLKAFYVKEKPIVLHGDDYDVEKISALYGVEKSWWVDHGVTLLFCHRSKGISSTFLRQGGAKSDVQGEKKIEEKEESLPEHS